MTYINSQRQYRPKGSAVGKVELAVHLQGDLPRNDTTVARHIFPPHPEKRRQYQALSLSTNNSRRKDPSTSCTFFGRLRVRPAICPRLTYSGKKVGDGLRELGRQLMISNQVLRYDQYVSMHALSITV